MQDAYIAEGELVGLRPVMPDDAAMLYEVWHDPDTQRNLNFGDDAPLAEWWDDMSTTRSWLDCVIVELASERPAGTVSLGWIGHDPELIVLLLPEFRRRGLGTEAARLIIDYGFATMGLASVGGGAFHYNTASQRMLDKLGYARRPDEDASYPDKWGEGSVTELAYHLDRATWEQNRTALGPVRPRVFDARRALDTIRALDIIRLCGSEGERQAMEIIAKQLDQIGVAWRYQTFLDNWLEPDDPHLLLRGRKLPVRPVLEFQFQSGFDFMSNVGLEVNVEATLAPAADSAGKIAVAEGFDHERPVEQNAAAQLMAFAFCPELEPHLWGQMWEIERVPAAYVMPEDVPFVLDSLGEPAVLKWRAKKVEREFRNLVAEIPGTEKPDELVVMGAHIDSFPGTVGSSDDASGCAVLVEAARWFAANPPARTVRLVWFTGEEPDRRGSRRYADECITDPAAVKLVVNVDHGYEMYTGPMKVYVYDDETARWDRELLNFDAMELFILEDKRGASPHCDAGPFSILGIPTFMACGKSKQPAHLPDDRPESIDPHKLQVLGSLSLEVAIRASACGNL